ncbi:MAG TPA: DUF4160 domain-containing protein [Steroidobacteraceae bacterium]
MSTILRVGKLRVMIYSRDHPPPHVHVVGPGGTAPIQLAGSARPPLLMENEGLSKRQLAGALRAVLEHREILDEAWSRIHDQQ